jgi:hypothetical protein
MVQKQMAQGFFGQLQIAPFGLINEREHCHVFLQVGDSCQE